MKKLTLVIFISFLGIVEVEAQEWIENLTDITELSKLSLQDLETTLNNFDWFSPELPVQKSNGTVVELIYSFNTNFGARVQTVQRTIYSDRSTGTRKSKTTLLMNYRDLIQKIEEELPSKEYELIEDTYHELVYQKEKTLVVLTKGITSGGYFNVDIYIQSN